MLTAACSTKLMYLLFYDDRWNTCMMGKDLTGHGCSTTMKIFIKALASFPFLPPVFDHTASDQKLEVGMA